MERRSLLKGSALIAALGPVLGHAQFGSQTFTPSIFQRERLEQGPFDVDQDEGWLTALFTTTSEKTLRNPGLGLVGYTWEESGPSPGRSEEHTSELQSRRDLVC